MSGVVGGQSFGGGEEEEQQRDSADTDRGRYVICVCLVFTQRHLLTGQKKKKHTGIS